MSKAELTAGEIAGRLTAGARRAVLRMTEEWQFCGKATFDANGAWNAANKARSAVERECRKDGKWSRDAYRLTPLGLAVRAILQDKDHQS